MRQAEIQIGGEYRVRIGDRLAPVTVVRRLDGRGRSRFLCMTQDTQREIKATAARLRPLVAAARPAAAPQAVAPSAVPAAWDGHPGDAWLPLVAVPGLLPSRGDGRVLRLSQANHAFVRRVVNREHVAEGMMRIARVVRASIAARIQWRTIPRALRRGILFTAACIHFGNRERYTAVMGHAPLPSPRAIAEAASALERRATKVLCMPLTARLCCAAAMAPAPISVTGLRRA